MDNKSKEERSANMSKVRSKNTGPELLVRSLLHRMGYRFRLHRKDIFGKPDIVLPHRKIVIFVNGCFWHAHEGCRKSKLPTSNVEFWNAKISKNIERDKEVNSVLLSEGWRVLRIWQCSLNSKKNRESLQEKLKNWIESADNYGEI